MPGDSRDLHDAAWPDMFENLQTAYGELSRTQFQLERRASEIDEARGLFQRVIRSMSEALFLLDTNGRIVQTNQAASQLLNIPEDAIVGRTLREVCGSEMVPETPWQLLEKEPGGTLRNLDIELRQADGRRVAVSVSCALARDQRGKVTGLLAVLGDITERKRAEDTLRLMAEASTVLARSLNIRSVLRELAHVIVPTLADWCSIDVIGDDDQLEHFAAAHVEPDAEPLIGELRRRFVPPADTAIGYVYVLRTRELVLIPVVSDRHLSHLADPEHRRLLARLGFSSHLCVPILARSRTIGAITLNFAGSGRRYTAADVKVAEDLARRASAAIENARLYHAAQDANRMKDEFLATLSHELRTPLNAILGWVQLLRLQSPHDPGLDRGLEVVERNATAQRQLIEDLLDLSGIVAGKVRCEPQPVDLAQVIETAVEGLRLAADAKHIVIDTHLHDGPARVDGDPGRLRQVIANLLSNAIKFTPDAGRVDVSLTRAGGHLEVAVTDNGIGIRREFLPHVFDRFRQQDPSTTRAYGGLGLGLAIVKYLVSMHSGEISVDSAGEGTGSRFTVRLPAMGDRPAEGEAGADGDAAAEAPDLRGLRVLVVEDEPDARGLLRLLLGGWGATVSAATTVADAMSCMQADPPDLLITDIGLPGEDGYSLLRRVRALPEVDGGRIPVIALTAYARDEDRRRARAAGFRCYLSKPFAAWELAAGIAAALADGPSPVDRRSVHRQRG
jgi:PAS domain S-box-containing protein